MYFWLLDDDNIKLASTLKKKIGQPRQEAGWSQEEE
jgi:hypothetical protein